MSTDKEVVSQEGESMPDADENTGPQKLINEMSELFQGALLGMQMQNISAVDLAARTAEALYETSKREVSRDQLLILGIVKNMISILDSITRATVFQIEGRFARASEEVEKGLATSNNSLIAIENFAQQPNADKEILQNFKPILLIFPILFKGISASIRAETMGYQGNIPQYRKLLREAVAEFREARFLPSSLNPFFLALVGLCASLAERLETRIEVFGSKQEQRYLIPTGDKIFIIHGHDEAKWRELRDVLEDKLDQKTIVLKEESGASETLIGKFEKLADDCCYAFALLTPDDFVKKEDKSYFQARLNVLFELGWFYGRFGRDRVCIIKKAQTEIPSDLAGILSIDFHEDVSEGFVKIHAELRRVGIITERAKRLTRRPTEHTKKRHPGEF